MAQWNLLKSRLGHGGSLLRMSKGVPSLRPSRGSWMTGYPVAQCRIVQDGLTQMSEMSTGMPVIAGKMGSPLSKSSVSSAL